MADYKIPVLDIEGAGTGDLGGALAYVQAESARAASRHGCSWVSPGGPGAVPGASCCCRSLRADVQPPRWRRREPSDYSGPRGPGRRDGRAADPAGTGAAVTGVFALHNQEISVAGRARHDPRWSVRTDGGTGSHVPRRRRVAVEFTAHGRAGGARLPAFIGLPPGIRMAGRRRGNCGSHRKTRRLARWPVQIDVNSTLGGLQCWRHSRSRRAAGNAPDARAARHAWHAAERRGRRIGHARGRSCVSRDRTASGNSIAAPRVSMRSRCRCRHSPGLLVNGRMAASSISPNGSHCR